MKTNVSLFAFALICSWGTLALGEIPTTYQLTAKDGPWLVMATVFADENPQVACDKAVKLAEELRRDYRMKAYVYEKDSQEGTVVESDRLHWVIDKDNPDAKPQVSNKYRYLNPSVQSEFTVLVGDFQSLEDSRATRTLEKIRRIYPKCLRNGGANHPLLGQSAPNRSPLTRAFVTPNPMIPRERFVSNGLDPVVVAANKGIKKYSLLDCPGTYSVQVAVLKGVSTLNQQKIAEIQKSDENLGVMFKSQTLADADENAMILCNELRAKGYEAYVFRDHYASIVTIGSFDNVGRNVNGNFVLTPQIMNIFKTFSATCDPSKGLAGIQRKTLRDIPSLSGKDKKRLPAIAFDVTPKVILVPRRPVVNTGGSFAGL
ncbi:MAG: hypothetical protein Q4D98_01550 [Planctomycetia bacterium]|nr:hypothetical protein [Planctomycetia bacterium]